MGFLTNLISAAVKIAITPIAIAKDVVNVITDQETENTKRLLESASKDIKMAGDAMLGENEDEFI